MAQHFEFLGRSKGYMARRIPIAGLLVLFAASTAFAGVDPPKEDTPTKSAGTTSQIQVVYPPADIKTTGDDDYARTSFDVRALAEGLKKLHIVNANIRDEESSVQLTTNSFELECDPGPCDKDVSTKTLTTVTIKLKSSTAGKYSGSLFVAAEGDTAGQSIPLKVFIRPSNSWWIGGLAIFFGAVVSWFALFWVARQRQMAGSLILIARLEQVLNSLSPTLQKVKAAAVPGAGNDSAPPLKTLAHIQEIRKDGFKQLKDDKELSILAGVTVPPTNTISVVDDVEGVRRIVLHGFAVLLGEWNAPGADRNALAGKFRAMDTLGGEAQTLSALDAKVQTIVSPPPPGAQMAPGFRLPQLPSEDTVVNLVVNTSYILDAISVAVVVGMGVYVLVWKNPGFGTVGNYIEAFLWGLGLKIGGDLTKLGPGDIRSSFNIQTPKA